MNRNVIITLALFPSAPLAFGQLVTGDVQIIAFSTKAPKDTQLAFVLWTDLAADTNIYFTDSGFFSSGTLRDTEGLLTWTAPAGGVAAGTVVAWRESTGLATLGSATGLIQLLPESSDQLFVGTTAFPQTGDTSDPGSTYSGTLLHGLNVGTSWDATATSDDTSALPASLVGNNIVTSVSTNIRNGEFTLPRTGLTIEGFQAAINDPANWTYTQSANFNPSTEAFTFLAVPEPSTVVPLGALMGLALVGHRRRPRTR